MAMIWTHESTVDQTEKPWTAMRIEAGENPYETLAQHGDKAGACYGETEIEAITNLIETEHSQLQNNTNRNTK